MRDDFETHFTKHVLKRCSVGFEPGEGSALFPDANEFEVVEIVMENNDKLMEERDKRALARARMCVIF